MVVYNPETPIMSWEEYQKQLYDIEAAFIGPPRCSSDPYWCPSPSRSLKPKAQYWFFANYMLLPPASDVIDWIRENATGEVHMYYTWEVAGRTKRAESKKPYIYTPGGDAKVNARFEKMLRNVFIWLDKGQAFTVGFHLNFPPEKGNDFKTRFPWRYEE